MRTNSSLQDAFSFARVFNTSADNNQAGKVTCDRCRCLWLVVCDVPMGTQDDVQQTSETMLQMTSLHLRAPDEL